VNYITSSFSLQMIPEGGLIEVIPCRLNVYEWGGQWRIGHEGTAQNLSKKLGFPVHVDRTPVSLQVGDEVIVCQPVGNRAPTGTELGADVELAYFHVIIHPPLRHILGQVRKEVIHQWRLEHDPAYADEDGCE